MILITAKTTLAAAIALLAASSAHALPAWERIGPEGGSICALAAAPSRPATLYAGGADGGVFRSTDRGLTWTFAGTDLGANGVCSLAVAGRNPSRVWALAGGRLFRSSDGGGRWLPLDAPVQDLLLAVVAHPKNSNLIFLIGDHGVRRSTDGGVTWSEPLAGLPTVYTTDLVLDPLRPDHMFVASADGIFRSLDGGRGWTPIHHGLPESFGHAVALAIDSRDGRTLYAASGSGRLYRSPDSGSTWKKAALPQNVSVITLAVGGRALFVASANGLWTSRDGGRSFAPTAVRLAAQRVADVVSLPYAVLAATTAGIYRSPDAGLTFASSQRGLEARAWLQLEIDPNHPERWYALDRNEGLLRSGNGGATWRKSGQELRALDLFAPPSMLALDPESSRVYTNFASVDTGGGLARTDDAGRTWAVVANFGCFEPFAVLPDAPRARLLISGGFLIGACGLQPGACSVYRSLDDGLTFTCARDVLPDRGPALAVHPPSGDLFAASSTGLQRSPDWADHWTVSSAERPIVLQVSPADPDVFFAVIADGSLHPPVKRSTDQGATWNGFAGWPPGFALYPDPFGPDRLYSLTGQLYVSDGGPWRLASAASSDIEIKDIAFDPRHPDTIFAASTGGGLMRLRLEP